MVMRQVQNAFRGQEDYSTVVPLYIGIRKFDPVASGLWIVHGAWAKLENADLLRGGYPDHSLQPRHLCAGRRALANGQNGGDFTTVFFFQRFSCYAWHMESALTTVFREPHRKVFGNELLIIIGRALALVFVSFLGQVEG